MLPIPGCLLACSGLSRADLVAWQGGQGEATEAYFSTPQEAESAAQRRHAAKAAAKECPRQDSNLYALSGTGPSNQPVYQFQHVGICNPESTRRPGKPDAFSARPLQDGSGVLGEGLEPSRGCPHRILNPARLPIPPPEPNLRTIELQWSRGESNP